MKRIVITLLFAMAFWSLRANPVDVETAKSLGIKFMKANTEIKSDMANLVYTAYTDNDEACFYVFSMRPKGFVIVSADDRSKPILGYSTESAFNAEVIPEGLQSFFNNYRAGFSQMMENNEARTEMAAHDWKRLAETGKINDAKISREVKPLLTCCWNQSALYNRYCPADALGPDGHVYSGCVATAMSQIMYYWQWPRRGSGFHSYELWPYGVLSAYFENTEYHFDLMPDFLDWTSADEEINAVALLQFHAGISVDMGYSPEGSGAYSPWVVSALSDYFRYDDVSMHMESLDWYSSVDWEIMLRDNLDSAMPLYYSASGYDGGHAFVCDGYDDNNMFHFNWGWQGFDNGYYPIDGFYLSHYSFPEYHQAIFGIYPNMDYCFTPQELEDFQVEAIGTGTNRISFTTPTMTICEFGLSKMDSIIFVRNGEIIHKEFDMPVGTSFSYEDHDAPGISHYTVFHYSDIFPGRYERDTILNGPTCEMTFHLHDSIGDGWTAPSISIVDSRGVAIKRLGLAEGSEAIEKVEVPLNEELALHWAYTIGGKDDESSFEMYDWNGSLVYATEGKPIVGELCRFYANCSDAVPEGNATTLTLYPNPTETHVVIEGVKVERVRVYNALGQLVAESCQQTIDFSGLESGMYFLQVMTREGEVFCEKVIKK